MDLMTLFEVRYNHVMLSESGFFQKCCKISILFSSLDTQTVKTLCPIHSQHSQIWQVFTLAVTNESVVSWAIKRKRTSLVSMIKHTTQNTRYNNLLSQTLQDLIWFLWESCPVYQLCAVKTQKIGEIFEMSEHFYEFASNWFLTSLTHISNWYWYAQKRLSTRNYKRIKI